ETRLATLEQVRSQEPVPPRLLQPQVPLDLETICLKCLQKEAGKRYASADALAEDLRRFQAHEPILARRSSWLERTGRWCRRNPAIASLVAVVATLLVAVAISATAAAVQFRLKAEAEAKAKEELESSLYFHSIALAHRELSRDNLGRALVQLEECPEEL